MFVSILDLLVHNARIEGNLDSGIVDMKANVIELQGTPKVRHHVIRLSAFCGHPTLDVTQGLRLEHLSILLILSLILNPRMSDLKVLVTKCTLLLLVILC